MVTSLFIAFWNVENLFDTESAKRPERIAKILAKDIKGWNSTLLTAKLKQLSLVIRSMNGGNGPDILGVCEVENHAVLDKLTKQIAKDGGRTYDVAHADTSDNRGIDVAFLFDPAMAKTTPDQIFQRWIVKRYATRELFQVNFVINKKRFVIVGNHWPSRSAGQYESEPYRMTAGETLAYWMERIHEEHGEDVPAIVMGDFNDEPFNRSLTEYALSVNSPDTVLKAKTNRYLLNLMWPILAAGKGSLVYSGRWNMLDQILVSRGIVGGDSGWIVARDARVEATEIMSYPKKIGPHRFGIKPNERDTEGFSDHFPVSVELGLKG